MLVPLGDEGILNAFEWWALHQDDGVALRIEQAFESAASEEEGIEAANAIARRRFRRSKRFPLPRRRPDATARLLREAYTTMTVGTTLGASVVGSDYFRAVVELYRIYTDRMRREGEEVAYLKGLDDDPEGFGQHLAVLMDVAGASDDPPLPRARNRAADLAMLELTSAAVIRWNRDALALLDRAFTVLEVAREIVPDDPIVEKTLAIMESNNEADLDASAALLSLAKPRWIDGRAPDWNLASQRIMHCCRGSHPLTGPIDFRGGMKTLRVIMTALPELIERIYEAWPADQLDSRDSRSTLDPEIAELKELTRATYDAIETLPEPVITHLAVPRDRPRSGSAHAAASA
ncbi:hypothetical protein ACWGFX_30435 [Streptomyces xanthophaeus]|uniref:hypothetical protein n=1 Tax=Streptomyces xanthophaeus TaxID=67385 RepID=UPI0004CDB46E|nr:hypothetical protein [Streptomyces xanthophaeus]